MPGIRSIRLPAPGLRTAIQMGLLLSAAFATLAAAPAERPDPRRWEEAIDQLVARDRQAPPEPGGIVFMGSSSIRMWDLSASFPDRRATNYGFGGSHLADTVYYLDRLVVPLQPKVLVVYAGDNDIQYGLSPEQVLEDFDRLVARLEKDLPHTRLLYIAIKPSRARWPLFPKMAQANQLIAARCAGHEQLEFVDIVPAMLGDDGRPRGELFREDGLHLSDQGYRLWTEQIAADLARFAGPNDG